MAMPTDAEIDQLSPDERIRLIERLWSSFVNDPSSLPVSDAQRAELRRRLADHEANPDEARPWPEVRAELDRE
jgi:putative addiction module component (TIGR02574 family)